MRSLIVLLSLLLSSTAVAKDQVEILPIEDEVVVNVSTFKPLVFEGKDGELKGFDIELWKAVAEEANLSYRFEKVDFKQIKSNLEQSKADVGLSGISIKEDREKTIDFSHSYFSAGLHAVVRSDTELALGQLANSRFLNAFFYLFLFVTLCGHIIWYSERGTESAINDKYFPGIFEAFWWAFVTMTTVGYGDIAPRKWLGRVVAVFVMFSGIIFFGWWVGAVSSAMSVERLKTDIEQPEDLNGLKVATKRGTTSEEAVRSYGAKATLVDDISKAYSLLQKGDVRAVVFDAPSAMYFVNNNDSFTISGKMFDKQNYGFALQEDSPLTERLNRALLAVKEDGTYDKLYRKWFGK